MAGVPKHGSVKPLAQVQAEHAARAAQIAEREARWHARRQLLVRRMTIILAIITGVIGLVLGLVNQQFVLLQPIVGAGLGAAMAQLIARLELGLIGGILCGSGATFILMLVLLAHGGIGGVILMTILTTFGVLLFLGGLCGLLMHQWDNEHLNL
jgi:hypothetical protein